MDSAKRPDALRLGFLGASKIACVQPHDVKQYQNSAERLTRMPGLSVHHSGQSHPETIGAAVDARDEMRAQTCAKSHRIPHVHASYQALLHDPKIDAVYVALPTALHYEWAMKALKAGKHVLQEKPSTSNASKARDPLLHDLHIHITYLESKETPLDSIPMKRFSTVSILPVALISQVERAEGGTLVTDAMPFANGIQSIE